MKRNMRLFVVVLLATACSVAAQSNDSPLSRLRAMLAPVRANPRANLETRGATSQFDVIKHQLWDWIESKLSELKPNVGLGPCSDG